MFPNEIIKEANSLYAQIEKGVVVIPAISSFLSKIQNAETSKPQKKTKKQAEEEAITRLMTKMASRKRTTKKMSA